MKETTIKLISGVLGMDDTISPEEKAAILRVCKTPAYSKELITAKQAMAILEVSKPTLRGFVKAGKLNPIKYSCRKIRYDSQQVWRLRDNGI